MRRRRRARFGATVGGLTAPAYGRTRFLTSDAQPNDAPTVELTAPGENAYLIAGVPNEISWTGSDSDGTIETVAIYFGDPDDGGTLLATGNAATGSFNWTPGNELAGPGVLYARATDDQGATGTSAGRPVTINLPPTVVFTSPAPQPDPGVILNIGTAYTFAWNASDPDGTINLVELFVNDPDLSGWVLATGPAVSSYEYTPSGAELGSNVMYLRATDNNGATYKSAGLPVYVNARPEATITAPAGGASLQVGVATTISWTSSDYYGSVSSVALYLGHPDSGGTLLHTGTASGSYSYTPQAGQEGARTLYARPTDNLGQTGLSAGVAVTVAAANANPTATITAPAGGAVLVIGSATTISWTSSDSDGTVSSVALYLGDPGAGGTLLHTGGASGSYSYTPQAGQEGARTLYARATDNQGATGTSAGRAVTIKTAVQNAIDSINALGPAAFYYNGFTLDSGNAEAGDQISQWTDLSGNGRHATQSTQNDQPTIASVGPEYALTFNGVDGTSGDALSLTAAPYSGAAALTTFTAARRTSRTTAHEVYSGTGGHLRAYWSTTGSDAMRLYVSSAAYAALSGITFLNTDQVLCVRFDGAGVDNAARLKAYTGNVERTLTFTGTIPATVPSMAAMTFGRTVTSVAPAEMIAYLFLVFASALSDADRNAVNGHLQTLLSWY